MYTRGVKKKKKKVRMRESFKKTDSLKRSAIEKEKRVEAEEKKVLRIFRTKSVNELYKNIPRDGIKVF